VKYFGVGFVNGLDHRVRHDACRRAAERVVKLAEAFNGFSGVYDWVKNIAIFYDVFTNYQVFEGGLH
jgi:hypothetical protein